MKPDFLQEERGVRYQMEMLDIRNEDGSLTGEKKERTLVHRDGDLHGTAHVWLVRYRSDKRVAEVLLQKRSACKDSFPGCYDISSAGHIPAGEDFLPSAVRELREELGVTAKPEELHELFTHRGHAEETFYGKPFINNEYSKVYLMEYTGNGSFQLQAEEVESVRWMDYRACLDGIRNATLKNCIFEDEFEKVARGIEAYFAETGRPLAGADRRETWAEDAQNDLQDWIEEQGIYIRQ